MPAGFIDYRFTVLHDAETGQMVAAIPALGISDYGPDSASMLDRLRDMAAFHLECLLDEGSGYPGNRMKTRTSS